MNALLSPQPLAVGEPPPVVTNTVQNNNSQQTYAAQLTQPKAAGTSIPNPSKTILKPFEIVHGEPTVKFTMEELRKFTVEEGLHQALVLKFSFERLEMHELRKSLPKLLGTHGHNLVGWLARRHILIRFDLYEDYVVAASKVVNHLLVNGEKHQFRIFPRNINFNPKEETSRAFVWISLPNLPPMLFAKQSLLSIASVIGKPIAIDKATQEKSRPSTARVKVELDLLDKRPHRVRIHYVEEKTEQIVELFQQIVYDNLPQYCSYCKHQGHGESSCHFLQDDKQDDENATVERKNVEKYQGDLRNLLDEKKKAVHVTEQMNTRGPVQVAGLVPDGVPTISAASEEKKKAVVSGGETTVVIEGQKSGQKQSASTDGKAARHSTVGKASALVDVAGVDQTSDAQGQSEEQGPEQNTTTAAGVGKDSAYLGKSVTGYNVDIEADGAGSEQHKVGGTVSNRVVVAQNFETKQEGHKSTLFENRHGTIEKDEKGDDTNKKRGDWNVVTGIQSPAKSGSSSKNQKLGARRNECNIAKWS